MGKKEQVILCVDDEHLVLNSLREELRPLLAAGYRLEMAETGEEALELFEELIAEGAEVPLVISDQIMPGMKGVELLVLIHEKSPETLTMMLTGQADVNEIGAALNHANLRKYIAKPWDSHELQHIVRSILREYAIHRELEEYHRTIEEKVQLTARELEESLTKFKILAKISPIGIFLTNIAGKLEYANRKMVEIVEKSLSQLLQSDWMEQIHPDDAPATRAQWQGMLDSNEPFHHVFRIIQTSGTPRWVLGMAICQEGKANIEPFIIGTLTDITEQIALQERMAALNASLKNEVQAQVKSLRDKDHLLIQQSKMAALGDMVNSIAHQWRQPLTGLHSMMALALDAANSTPPDVEEIVYACSRGQSVTEFLSRTIDDFRRFFSPTKIWQRFSPAESVQAIARMLFSDLKIDNIILTVEDPEAIFIENYENEFQQVAINFMSNARYALLEKQKHDSATREYWLKVSITHDDESIRIAFEDNGGGIDSAHLPHIFDPYYTTKGEKGTGTGLYMARMIVEKSMRGKLECRNTEQGAEFSIVLPRTSS
ncbi:response regulator [Chrysiogenes arsenatis]|uniref:response regulator n=1 Tax=Chrysiogenes arsenatis TaxID=309797 RepID=UPI0003FAAE3F|nr:response regulator [Chrysiogenes arsenatis]